jgi:hypothetical protein
MNDAKLAIDNICVRGVEIDCAIVHELSVIQIPSCTSISSVPSFTPAPSTLSHPFVVSLEHMPGWKAKSGKVLGNYWDFVCEK